MEPWPFSHGYVENAVKEVKQDVAFKGAMAFQPWIPAHPSPDDGRSTPFNGAMAFQPWIRGDGDAAMNRPCRLQWSHGLSAMDTTVPPAVRFWGLTFNGAMAFQPWIPRNIPVGPVPDNLPSMEPWPFSHGYP